MRGRGRFPRIRPRGVIIGQIKQDQIRHFPLRLKRMQFADKLLRPVDVRHRQLPAHKIRHHMRAERGQFGIIAIIDQVGLILKITIIILSIELDDVGI